MTLHKYDIFSVIEKHMYSQPFIITCRECGADLEYQREVDDDLDITLKIIPCPCQKRISEIDEMTETINKLTDIIMNHQKEDIE